jgi:diaminohydroxyphosphoribosylaminopyrimidine deaminase/5-amino-6-(5-phosphoribosylamino)uracil reductase
MSNPFSRSPNPEDDFWMGRALELARRGTALTHPNPMVGSVVVRDEQIIGEGFHTWEGVDHAEVHALEKAGAAARGATLYVTLEPCCHTGRTAPCTKSIMAAGISRVVAAMRDPNPRVAGRGLRELRRGGVEVVSGVRETEAKTLNEDFACWIRLHRPMVTLKSAATVDGQIAARDGSATWITSEKSRDEVQELRHAADALLTGIGTVLADNPNLTDRSGKPRRRPLLRVVLDSRLRLPLKSKLVKDSAGDVLVFTAQSPDSPKARALRKAGIEVVHVDMPPEAGNATRGVRRAARGVELQAVIGELARREVLGVLLEAGAELNGAALRAGIVDKLVLFLAPKILGGGHVPIARSFSTRIGDAPLLEFSRLRFSGPDAVLEGYFRDVYGDNSKRRKN